MPIALSAMEVDAEASVGGSRLEEFLKIAERRRPQLLRMARRLTQTNEDAEDVVQEAFMKAYKALAKFRGESQMSSWLGAIVQNTAHEHLRSHRNRVFVSIEHLSRNDNEVVEIDLPDPGKNPEQIFQSKQIEMILRDEVGKLGRVCRHAIETCVLDERPQLAVARTLNLSVATMKSRVFRGKRVLERTISRRLATRGGSMAMSVDHRVGCEM